MTTITYGSGSIPEGQKNMEIVGTTRENGYGSEG